MQFLYLYLVGRDTSEVIKASSWRAKRFKNIQKSHVGYIWWRQERISTEVEESHGACANIHACLVEGWGEDSECIGMRFQEASTGI